VQNLGTLNWLLRPGSGQQAAIRLKFAMVRDVLTTGDREKVNYTVDKSGDFLESLIG
jgi:hypothetical protein